LPKVENLEMMLGAGGCKAHSGSRVKPWSGVQGAKDSQKLLDLSCFGRPMQITVLKNWFVCPTKKGELAFIVINIPPIPPLSQKISQTYRNSCG